MAIPTNDTPRHLVHPARPVYMDDIFRGGSPQPSSTTPAPVELAAPSISRAPSQSISSVSSWRSFSISSVSTHDSPGMPSVPRSPGSTRSLPTTQDDSVSIRSIRSHLSPRFRRMRSFWIRRRPDSIVDEVEETTPTDIFYGASTQPFQPEQFIASSSISSAPASQASSNSSSSKYSAARDQNCRPCYYAYARRCPGFVLGGSHGDACDACAVCVATFFHKAWNFAYDCSSERVSSVLRDSRAANNIHCD